MDSQLRGLQRVLAREVAVSDLLQHLTDLDPQPWETLLGFVPVDARRESKLARLSTDRKIVGSIDLLLLRPDGQEVAIELKVGHEFSADQQHRYEKSTDGQLVLAGLASDSFLAQTRPRWRFLNLSSIFRGWVDSPILEASVFASAIAEVFEGWDAAITAVFRVDSEQQPLAAIRHRFLATVVARRISDILQRRGIRTWSGVTSGSGGLAMVQASVDIHGDEQRRLMAEVRWRSMDSGDLRLGVDYCIPESRQARAQAWALATAMDDAIRISSFRDYLAGSSPGLDALLTTSDAGRKPSNEDNWRPVIEYGFKSNTNADGLSGGRRRYPPGFLGDRTQRFQASSGIDFSTATANDLVSLLQTGLHYLQERVPTSPLDLGRAGLAPPRGLT